MLFTQLRLYLPAVWVDALEGLSSARQACIQELRLRANQPVVVSTPAGEQYLGSFGLTQVKQQGVFRCSAAQLEDCFLAFCQQAVYAHEDELRQGFLSVPGGLRVGIAGRAVVKAGIVTTMTDITSLCVRLPRAHRGCAAGLVSLVTATGRPTSTLLVGEPSSGKTSLLRDLAAGLAARGWRVAVVDERGELAGPTGLPGCDVLVGCPKGAGVRQAVRCLAPQVVMFDELGDEDEIQAVAACAHAGVAVVASLHGSDPAALGVQPAVRGMIEKGMFAQWVFLEGRQSPGKVARWLLPRVMGHDVAWCAVDHPGRDWAGPVLLPPLISAS